MRYTGVSLIDVVRYAHRCSQVCAVATLVPVAKLVAKGFLPILLACCSCWCTFRCWSALYLLLPQEGPGSCDLATFTAVAMIISTGCLPVLQRSGCLPVLQWSSLCWCTIRACLVVCCFVEQKRDFIRRYCPHSDAYAAYGTVDGSNPPLHMTRNSRRYSTSNNHNHDHSKRMYASQDGMTRSSPRGYSTSTTMTTASGCTLRKMTLTM